jgi:hypothetical protein
VNVDSVVQGVIALVVLIGTFGLLGVYAIRGQAPDSGIIAAAGPLAGMVVGWYFGSRGVTSGVQTATNGMLQAARTIHNAGVEAASNERTAAG